MSFSNTPPEHWRITLPYLDRFLDGVSDEASVVLAEVLRDVCAGQVGCDYTPGHDGDVLSAGWLEKISAIYNIDVIQAPWPIKSQETRLIVQQPDQTNNNKKHQS